MAQSSSKAQAPAFLEVLHYLGYDKDHGGIVSVVRALAQAGRFRCLLGVNPGFTQRQSPPLEIVEFPRVEAESLAPATWWRAFVVARQVRRWLRRDTTRVFHAHSRAGLAVVLLLRVMGETRVLATVHVFGNLRWVYRCIAALLGRRLFWLSPAMEVYYGAGPGSWDRCLPDCVSPPMAIQRRRLPSDVCRFGAVGPYLHRKQWDLLIEALAILPVAVRACVRIIHVGGEEDHPRTIAYGRYLRTLTQSRGVEECIEWRGLVVPLTDFWSEVDCLLVVSSKEPFSVAAVEAVAAGVPVLASSLAGTRDLVNECDGGWLFPGDSPAGLAAQISHLVQDGSVRVWRPKLGAVERFLAPKAVEAYLAAYWNVLT